MTRPARYCVDCGVVLVRRANSIRCGSCADRFSVEVKKHPSFIAMQAAHRAVNKAVKLGRLDHISTQLCVDCGAPAQFYDHRQYARPLAVEPVCGTCNKVRGPAVDWLLPSSHLRASNYVDCTKKVAA